MLSLRVHDDFRAGYVALVGLPNAGKSTLANVLVGEKFSIVSAKAQTTRQRSLGIYTDENLQAVFVDAPGAINATAGLNAFLNNELTDVMDKADALVVTLNVDAKDPERLLEMIRLAASSKKPWMALITKCDTEFAYRIPKIEAMVEPYGVKVLTSSALKRKNDLRDDLLPVLKELLPVSKAPLFDPELFTPQSTRELVCEIIREKCFTELRHELPYGLAVRIAKFIEDDGPIPKIYAEIVVSKENHKSIIIGRGGQLLKNIGKLARKDIEQMMGSKIYLDLHVALKKNWMKQDVFLKEMGYVVGK